MKVIHLISGGDTGGAKTHVFTLLNELKNHIDITLVCLTPGAFYEEAAALGIPTLLIQQKNRLDFRVMRKLVKIINAESVDLLHCHGARANFLAAMIKKYIQVPVVTTMHSDYTKDFSHQWMKDLIFTKLNRYSLEKMDYYFAVTKAFEKMLIEQGFEEARIRVIYNGIHVDEVDPKQLLPKNLKFPIFGCVTTLRPIKGTHVLLKAVKIVKDAGYSVVVLIAGGGKGRYVDNLHGYVKRHGLEKNVAFLGYVKDINEFYERIHVNILPSYTESFPYALLEGGIREKGTIASKAGGIVEMIIPDEDGLLFEVGDEKELADCMIDYIENPEKIRKNGKAFRQRIVKRFSDQVMAERHIHLYDSIINSH